MPVHLGVHYGCPIHVDMVIIAEIKDFFVGEMHAIVGDDGV
jgi:hypothetical protein